MAGRDARSERRRIGRKLGGGGAAAAAAAAAEIGSRVFPLPAPSPAPMPAVGARRSTRVFVPKSSRAGAVSPTSPESPARVLRSGKRLALSSPLTKQRARAGAGDEDDAWLGAIGRGGEGGGLGGGGGGDGEGLKWSQRKNWWHIAPAEAAESSESADEKPLLPSSPASSCVDSSEPRSFGLVYTRKRSRSSAGDVAAAAACSSSSLEERRFGLVFRRKQRRKRRKIWPLPQEASWDEEDAARELVIPSSSRHFAANIGLLEDDFLARAGGSGAGAVVLVALVDPSRTGSSCRFSRFLVSVLRWMRRTSRVNVRQFATFLLSGSIAAVFSLHGVHFLPLWRRKDIALSASGSCGLCKIYGAKKYVPMLSVDFSALPSYFKTLHLAQLLASMYLPTVLRQWFLGVRRSTPASDVDEEEYSHAPSETDSVLAHSAGSRRAGSERNTSSNVDEHYALLEQVTGISSGLKKHQRKRSSSRHPQNRQRSSVRFLSRAAGLKPSIVVSQSEAKLSLSSLDPVLEHVHPKAAALEISLDMLDNVEDSDVSTPVGSNGKNRRSALKSPTDRMNERQALAEVRQNIDSVRCKGNILYIQADRCWREEGAEVMLEVTDYNEWYIAVKVQGVTRLWHKPHELKPCVVNRYTHAYMWAVEEGWKLEFLEKWDWVMFKQLHIECRDRNSQGKMIPIPGVSEVPIDYVTGPFVRPEPDYITMLEDDEVAWALTKDSIYDMDSEDEDWVSLLNSTDSDGKDTCLSHISLEDFEKIITSFEKDAYKNPEDISNLDQLFARCPGLQKDDMVLAVYDYWIKKRNKKGVPLVRIFQAAPVKRAPQPSQPPSFKKKRSFKRQKSHAGRGNPEAFLQDSSEEEALRRVQEAESAARQAVETAVRRRTRAQALMANADLATYKAVMALRIADAARFSDLSPDLVSSILD